VLLKLYPKHYPFNQKLGLPENSYVSYCFTDGYLLRNDVARIANKKVMFLPGSRILPVPRNKEPGDFPDIFKKIMPGIIAENITIRGLAKAIRRLLQTSPLDYSDNYVRNA